MSKNSPNRQFMDFPIISDQVGTEELGVVWRELEKILQQNITGAVVEFGCYRGTTSLFIRRLLNRYQKTGGREFHVYDSFAGLPPKTSPDNSTTGEQFIPGELAVSKKQFLQEFSRAGLVPPTVHKGWFSDITPQDVPQHIAFAFLDGDFYQSIIDSLKLVWPKMSPGGVILIDDYNREALPGVTHAVYDFFNGRPPRIWHQHNVATLQA